MRLCGEMNNGINLMAPQEFLNQRFTAFVLPVKVAGLESFPVRVIGFESEEVPG